MKRITTIKYSEPPELLKFLETNISSAYSYGTHGCVERSNQQILNILSKKLEIDENWIDDIEKIIYQYNRTVHKSTGYAPQQIHFNLSNAEFKKNFLELPT